MAQAKEGDRVRVHYMGALTDGTVFDSSLNREPLEFVIGRGMVIPGFEKGVIGMEEGETKTISIPSRDAYGDYMDDLTKIVDRAKIPEDAPLKKGMTLHFRAPDGRVGNAVVKDLTDHDVTLDLNHPMAGKDLAFEVRLVKIVEE